MPLTIFFLLVAVGMLGYKARHRWGYIPLIIGMVGAIAIVAGKFYLDKDYLSKAGIFLLIAASVWNAWPRKGATDITGIHLEPYDENEH